MDYPLLLYLFFGLGILMQAILLTGTKLDRKKLLYCLLGSLFMFIPGKTEIPDYDWYMHLYFYFLFFSVVFSLSFKEEVLPTVTEQTVLSFNIIFLFLFFVYFYSFSVFKNWLLVMFIIPTIATLVTCCTNYKLNFFWKLFFYTWFLIMVLSITIWQFSFGHMSFFFDEESIQLVKPIDVIFTGMVFLYLVMNAWYILELIPIPGKHQTFKERIEQWKEHTNILTGKYLDYQIPLFNTLLITLIYGGVLILNYFIHFISDYFLINLILWIPSFILLVGNVFRLCSTKKKIRVKF